MDAFAVIVDINGFSRIVEASAGNLIAQYVRDVLVGGIKAIEEQSGKVVSFMGDAFLAILENAEQVCNACFMIAKDVDRLCEYISSVQTDDAYAWAYSPGGSGLAISIEYGWFDVSEICSNLLGEQQLFIGPPINYAHRIGQVGEGNRCHIGPQAAALIREAGFDLEGPFTACFKKGEPDREYYRFDLSDIWREGKLRSGDETYWG